MFVCFFVLFLYVSWSEFLIANPVKINIQPFSLIFGQLTDPRRLERGNFKHPLDEILFLAITSSICGIVDWDEIEMFGTEQTEWFRKYFPYKNGITSQDILSRLFAKLCPTQFCKYFTQWVQTLRKDIDKEVIAIDGKSVKGSATLLQRIGLCLRKSVSLVPASS